MTMETDTLVKSVGSYMDSLESITNWLIVIMLLKTWNAYSGTSEFEVLGAKITRRHAATILLGIYCFAFTALALQFGRLHEVLRYIPDAQFGVAATSVVTHAWLLNPFSYFGNDPLEMAFGAISFGLWPVIWWVGGLSLRSAEPDPKNALQKTLLGYYLLASFFVLLLIVFIWTSLARYDFGVSYWFSVGSKVVGIIAGALVGSRLFNKLVGTFPTESKIDKEED